MTTPYAIILATYLVGYFISFGITLGVFEKKDYATVMTAFMLAFLSWITIGMYLSSFLPSDENTEP